MTHVLRHTCAFTVITCLSRDIDIYRHFSMSHIFFNIARAYPRCTFICFACISKMWSPSPKNHCCFNGIELITTPFPKIHSTIHHLRGYHVIFHQRIRQIRRMKQSSSIFQLPQNLLDHCVKYQKYPCRLCPCENALKMMYMYFP